MAQPTQQDMQALAQLLSSSGTDWASLLGPDYGQAQANASSNALANQYGYYMTGQPAAGTPTLEADKLTGMFQGNPLAAEQEAYGQFGPNMGYLAGKSTLDAQRLYGNANGMAGGGAPTENAMTDFGYSGGSAGTGTRTLQGQQLDYQTALSAMDQLGKLQSNPFAMERVARGIDSTGIPNAVRGLMQGGAIPGFQAPQAQAQAPSLSGSLGVQNPGQGQGGGPATADPTSPDFDPAAAAGVNVDATTAAAPAPNKLNAVNYTTASPDLQSFIQSLYGSMGYNPDNVASQMKAQLPGFTAPRYGQIQA